MKESMNLRSVDSVMFRLAICILASSQLSCNQPFDPRGQLDKRTVLFSVLSTDRTTQYVRAERSYMPAGFDPLTETADNFVANASITISGGGIEARFRDTSLVRSDTSRYKFPIRAYVVNPLKPSYGVTYFLRIEGKSLEPAIASVLVPAKPQLSIHPSSFAVLDWPAEHDSSADILFPMNVGTGTVGYIYRLFVDYDLLQGGEWVPGRVEVPIGFTYSGLPSYKYLSFPILTHKGSTNFATGAYKNQFFKYALGSIAFQDFGSRRVIFNRIVFQILQVELNLYDYYVVTHAYRDPHSIRLDEPMYSSVEGGVGIVGAYTLDSLVHLLPEGFTYNRR